MADVKIGLGRLDDNAIYTVEEGMSIASALRVKGYEMDESDVIRDIEDNEYDGSEEVEGGKSYFLVESVKSGC